MFPDGQEIYLYYIYPSLKPYMGVPNNNIYSIVNYDGSFGYFLEPPP